MFSRLVGWVQVESQDRHNHAKRCVCSGQILCQNMQSSIVHLIFLNTEYRVHNFSMYIHMHVCIGGLTCLWLSLHTSGFLANQVSDAGDIQT